MTDSHDSDAASDCVRDLLANAPPGDWYVFETIVADGSLAIGVVHGRPEPAAFLALYGGTTEPVARAAAADLARRYRRQGRNIAAS